MTTDNSQGQTPGNPQAGNHFDVSGSQGDVSQDKLKDALQWNRLNPQPEPPSPYLNPQPEPPSPYLNPQPEPPMIIGGRFGRSFMLALMGVAFALIIGCGAFFAMGPGRPIYENVALSLGIDLGSLLLEGDQGATPTPIGEPVGQGDGTCFSPCTPGVTQCIGVLTCQTREDGSHICYDDQFCSCHTNGVCDPDESSVCPDCKPAPCTCGDGQCQADCQESAQSCPADCSGPTQVPNVPPPADQPTTIPTVIPTTVCSCVCTDTCQPVASCKKCVDSCTGAACTP